MKKKMGLIMAGALMLVSAGVVWGVSATYQVSAILPVATGFTFTLKKVTGDPKIPTNWTDATAINFGTLVFNPTLGIWLPDNYYALDVASQGGSNAGNVSFTYTEGQAPFGQGIGLGRKATANFMKLIFGDPKEYPIASAPMKELKDIGAVQIAPAATAGGWLRVYVGVATGDKNVAAPGMPFVGDQPGTYTGTLTVNVVAG